MILNPGQVVAQRYEIIEELGSGGMSIVYRARDKRLSRDVTIKVMRAEHVENPEFINRFGTEARAIASLNHPNIVNVYDVGKENDINFIVMEYINGATLKDRIVKRAPFSDVIMLSVASQIAVALGHAHDAGIIHRDIKPQNILVMQNGMVKVADFGIAVSARAHSRRDDDRDDSTMGSVHYISPEQACNDPVDPRSDLYSLGIVMYEMMTGELPFDGETAEEIAAMHMEYALPDPRKKNPNINEGVWKIIKKLASKQPDRRYKDAAELGLDLQNVLAALAKENNEEQGNIPLGSRLARPRPAVSADDFEDDDNRSKLKERVAIGGAVILALVLMIVFVPVLWRAITGNGEQVAENVHVPDAIGLQLEYAVAKFEQEGLAIYVYGEEYSEEFAAGEIIRMNFHPNDLVPLGRVIDVVVSRGVSLIEVPYMIAMDIDAAFHLIENMATFTLREDSREYHDDLLPNQIISQNPAPGERVLPGTTIYVVVSRGEDIIMVAVPSVTGLTEAVARERLIDAGLVVGVVSSVESAAYSMGLVFGQTMSAGRMVTEGTAVGFTVSAGPPALPEPTPSPDTTPEPTPPTDPTEDPTPEPTDDPTDEPTPTPAPPQITSRELRLNPTIAAGLEVFELSLRRQLPTGAMEEIFHRAAATPADLPIYIEVEGVGNVEFVLFINGVPVGEQVIDFDE